jgi:hypothetical protein
LGPKAHLGPEGRVGFAGPLYQDCAENITPGVHSSL